MSGGNRAQEHQHTDVLETGHRKQEGRRTRTGGCGRENKGTENNHKILRTKSVISTYFHMRYDFFYSPPPNPLVLETGSQYVAPGLSEISKYITLVLNLGNPASVSIVLAL